MKTITPELKEKLQTQLSLTQWLQENLSEEEFRRFVTNSGPGLGIALYDLENQGKVTTTLDENDNGTVTQKLTWDENAYAEFVKNTELVWALDIIGQYQNHLKTL
jgi:hypothetical protein